MRAGILTLALLGAMPARAQDDLRFSLTNTLVTEYRTNNQNGEVGDDRYGVLVDRLNLSGTAGGLTGTLRVDTFGFLDRPTPAHEDSIGLERITLVYRLGDWTLTAGDYFRQLGRGIVLSIRKVDEAGVDIAIRGGQAEFDGEVHRLSLFAGQLNPANIDSISQKFVAETEDVVAGGRYELALADWLHVGALGLYLDPTARIFEEHNDFTLTGGVYAELPEVAEGWSFYLEADAQRRELAGAGSEGYALYGTVDANLAGFTFLLEGLFLDDFEQRGSPNTAIGTRFEYNQPPTLERVDQEVFNNRDTLGGRLRAERLIEAWELLLYANLMLRLNDFQEAQELRQIHGFGGFEWSFDEGASRLFGSGGYRDETNDQGRVKTLAHFELDYLHAIGTEGAALHFVSNNELRTLAEAEFARGSSLLGVEMAGVGGVTLELGYDTQNPSEGVRNFFVATIVNLELGESVVVRATGGTQRGGIKCIAGVCRDYPEFAGARAELIVRM